MIFVHDPSVIVYENNSPTLSLFSRTSEVQQTHRFFLESSVERGPLKTPYHSTYGILEAFFGL